jgi:hypothetical protein
LRLVDAHDADADRDANTIAHADSDSDSDSHADTCSDAHTGTGSAAGGLANQAVVVLNPSGAAAWRRPRGRHGDARWSRA